MGDLLYTGFYILTLPGQLDTHVQSRVPEVLDDVQVDLRYLNEQSLDLLLALNRTVLKTCI